MWKTSRNLLSPPSTQSSNLCNIIVHEQDELLAQHKSKQTVQNLFCANVGQGVYQGFTEKQRNSNEIEHITQTKEMYMSRGKRRGRTSSVGRVLGLLSCLMQHCRFHHSHSLPLKGIFPLEFTWVLTPCPIKSFRWEYNFMSNLCMHAFRYMDSKSWHSCPRWVNAGSTNTRRQNVTTSMVGLKKKRSYKQKSHQKWWTPEIEMGMPKKKKKGK